MTNSSIMDSEAQSAAAAPASGSWWKPLARYQKEVFVLASLAWLFDCLGPAGLRHRPQSGPFPPHASRATGQDGQAMGRLHDQHFCRRLGRRAV